MIRIFTTNSSDNEPLGIRAVFLIMTIIFLSNNFGSTYLKLMDIETTNTIENCCEKESKTSSEEVDLDEYLQIYISYIFSDVSGIFEHSDIIYYWNTSHIVIHTPPPELV